MELEIDEVDCSFACVSWAFDCGNVGTSRGVKVSPEFQLSRHHPNSLFTVYCVYKCSSDKIINGRRHYTIQFFFEQNKCIRKQDKPISVLLGVIRGDKIQLKLYPENNNSLNNWKTEEIDINADNCIPAQTSNRPTSDVQPLRVTCKYWLKFNNFSLGELNLLTNLTDMFLNQTDCDVHFCFQDGQSIGAHVNILKIRSPVFAAMFEHEMEESKTGRVPIQDIDPDVFHQLLHYIYSGRTKTQLTEEIAQPLYVAADKYDIKVLRNEITFYLRSCIRVDNVIFLMIFAHLHSIENLKKSTIDFVKANAPQIVQQEDWANLIKNYPDLSVEVTRSLLG